MTMEQGEKATSLKREKTNDKIASTYYVVLSNDVFNWKSQLGRSAWTYAEDSFFSTICSELDQAKARVRNASLMMAKQPWGENQ